MIRLIAFLGNYGTLYEKTRHNVAWLFLEYLAASNTNPLSSLPAYKDWKEKFSARYSSLTLMGEKVHLLTPLTYMNKSGLSVGEAANFFKIKTAEILVIHDELELPFGVVSFKVAGGLGGHNGLRSIRDALGGQDFLRLRFGLGKPSGVDIADYVLSPFDRAQEEALPKIFSVGENLLRDALKVTGDYDLLAKKMGKVHAF